MTTSDDASKTVRASIEAMERHYSETILPAWRTAGFDRELALPLEALDAAGRALPSQRHRAMACARQLYVFAHAGERAHADLLLNSLETRFWDQESGGWLYSITPSGAPLDTSKDLYTHAFVIFACAEQVRRFGTHRAELLLNRTLAVVEDRFSTKSGDGLAYAALDRRFERVLSGPLQNPLMHLAEAYLAAREISDGPAFDERLTRLGQAIHRTFVDPRSGCVLELPLGAPDNRVEPGHQFEWFYLLHGVGLEWAPRAFCEDGRRAFAFAERYGIHATNLGVLAALTPDGGVLDAAQRIWAQTEYLRALAVDSVDARADELATRLSTFQRRFFTAEGWTESRDADGTVLRDEMPSTTPYHLRTSLSGLRKAAG